MLAGVAVVRISSRHGALSYFSGDRNLPWGAIAISNTATISQATARLSCAAHLRPGRQLALVVPVGSWDAFSRHRCGPPLAAGAQYTTAELITLRYGGAPGAWPEKSMRSSAASDSTCC